MKKVYLGRNTERYVGNPKIIVDPVPPKSTYYDHNRSNVVVSKTFQMPSAEALNELFEQTKDLFGEDATDTEKGSIL